MSGILKKLFSTLLQKPWEKEQMAIDTSHTGKTFNISEQKSAVIIIFEPESSTRSLSEIALNPEKTTV